MNDLLQYFPDAVELFRGDQPDDITYADKDFFPQCGFMSQRDAQILFDAAKSVGGEWLEIGSHVGFSAAVLASAGCRVTMVDPQYDSKTPALWQRTIDNLKRATLFDRVRMIGLRSMQYFDLYPTMFNGIFIDGDHGFPYPMADCVWADHRCLPGGIIAFHDSSGPPVIEAVDWLRSRGYGVEIHRTRQGIAICRKPL